VFGERGLGVMEKKYQNDVTKQLNQHQEKFSQMITSVKELHVQKDALEKSITRCIKEEKKLRRENDDLEKSVVLIREIISDGMSDSATVNEIKKIITFFDEFDRKSLILYGRERLERLGYEETKDGKYVLPKGRKRELDSATATATAADADDQQQPQNKKQKSINDFFFNHTPIGYVKKVD